MKIIRNKCVICDGDNLSVFLQYRMPVYNSDTPYNENFKVSDIKFSECLDCNVVQLKEFVEPEIVYQFNHNREIVGPTWLDHYDQFKDFISDVENKNVLEISDPVAKVAKKFTNYNKWFIVEPHLSLTIDDSKIHFIDEFFDDNFTIKHKIDIIVHSHFFEHTLKPSSFLDKCNELLEIGGLMYISTPNLKSILNINNNPNNILHFEHTFYFDENIVEYLANKSGFRVNRILEFKKHSLFIELEKISSPLINLLVQKFDRNSLIFLKSYNNYKKIIETINLSKDRYILFGCHVSSQFLIYNGLDVNKIDYIIDNSPSKQNNFLYGTNILTYSPNKITEDSLIIVSHMGIYADEIKEGLLKIKKDIKFI